MRRLYIYLHTHWDREWYLPFENFRIQLVGLVKKVCDLLQAEELPSFYLDGQSCVLEDVFEVERRLIRPVEKLMSDGRLALGPWFVLPDQMLVSGESLVRNLKIGLKEARRYGPPALVGYCPDTFGHSQDLPAILNGFGIESAIVWRGVPPLTGGPTFVWQGLDGSQVVAYHLSGGYYQTSFHESLPVEKLAQFAHCCLGLKRSDNGHPNLFNHLIGGALLPVGGDHLFPPEQFSGTIQKLNQFGQDKETEKMEVLAVSLPDFMNQVIDAVKSGVNAIPKVKGELRDNSRAKDYQRAYLLPGVLSSRLYLKRQNRLTEHRLIRICEPLLTFLNITQTMSYPHAELEHAWKLLLKNHPHDSICGCSIDAVHDEMTIRNQRVNQVLDALLELASETVACRSNAKQDSKMSQDAFEKVTFRDPQYSLNRLVVYNLSCHTVSQPILMRWADDGNSVPSVDSEKVQILSRQKVDAFFSGNNVVPYYKEVELVEGWVWAEGLPALGWKEFHWPMESHYYRSDTSVRLEERSIVNDFIRLTIADDGSVLVTVLDEKAKQRHFNLVHELKDRGDGGDTYNFDPIENDQPIKAKVRTVVGGLKGPLVGSLLVTYDLSIPERLVDDKDHTTGAGFAFSKRRSECYIGHAITTEITLRRGLPIVFFETSWQNESCDHRLEVVLRTGKTVTESFSENHFSVVHRKHDSMREKIDVADGEEALPDRYPCQRFFIANGQVFFNLGLPEYGIEGDGVTITLLRAISMLSRGKLRTRGGGAGPHIATPGANVLGHNKASYGWSPLDRSSLDNEAIAQAYRLACEFEGCLAGFLVRQENQLSTHTFFELDNKDIVLSALYCGEDGRDVFLRLLNVTASSKSVTLSLGFPIQSAHCVSLDERTLEPLVAFADKLASFYLQFGPCELKTIKFSLNPGS